MLQQFYSSRKKLIELNLYGKNKRNAWVCETSTFTLEQITQKVNIKSYKQKTSKLDKCGVSELNFKNRPRSNAKLVLNFNVFHFVLWLAT